VSIDIYCEKEAVVADDPRQIMRDSEPTCEYSVGIDADGCAFDTMEPKQKEVFRPTTIRK